MDEVLVRRWCDLCRSEDKSARVEAAARFSVRIDAERGQSLPRLVDCCEKHEAQLQGLQELVRRVGLTPVSEEVKPKHSSGDCPACGKRQTNLIAHLTKFHGAVTPKQPTKCPDCAFKTDNHAGMVNHRTRRHDYDYQAAIIESIPKRRAKK